MSISEDALVAVCLCTRLGRGDKTPALDAAEWTALARSLHERGLTPRALLTGDFGHEALLRGLGSVGMEIERLESNGIWILTRGDADYPKAFKTRLGPESPVVLFGAGPRAALNADLIAIEGSSQLGRSLAELCAKAGWGVVADASIADGFRVEVPAESLERAIARKSVREAILEERLTVVTAALPGGSLARGHALRLAYALCRYACVVSGKGAGALAALRDRLVPVYARADNRALLAKGALTLREPLGDSIESVFAAGGEEQREFEF